MKPAAVTRRWSRLGLRREVLLLLPVVLLLLVVLSVFTLFSYRNGVLRLLAERRAEAARLARGVAQLLAQGRNAPTAELQRIEPLVRGASLLDRDGAVLAAVGEIPNADLPRFLGRRQAESRDALDLDDPNAELVVGVAPLGAAAQRRYVRVDLAGEALAVEVRALRILTPSVLLLDGALVMLALLFLKHLLAPYETLLDRARRAGQAEGGQDEVEFLLSTFERALASLAQRGAADADGEGDLAALERTLSASLQSGLLLLDRRGRVLSLNPVGAELLGLADTSPGQTLEELLAAEPELLVPLAAGVRSGESLARQECTLRGGRTVGFTLHPLRRDDGEARGFLVLFADLTEARRKSEEGRLAESLAQLGELAGGVAHELRNSLATLRGYLTLIERNPEEEALEDYLSEIRRETDHLGRVLEDFLAFARPGSMRLEETPLGALIDRAVADPALAGVAVRVRSTGDRSLRMRIDAQLLERALRNLLHNAAQAEREAGRSGPVEVSVELAAEGIEIAVEDRGAGILPELRDRLFHPFVTGRRGGVGLGLALTQRIVVLHGGRVRLEDRPGGGARATLSLPNDKIVTIGNAAPSIEDPPSGPKGAA
jgi:signal transduction histidine kinase